MPVRNFVQNKGVETIASVCANFAGIALEHAALKVSVAQQGEKPICADMAGDAVFRTGEYFAGNIFQMRNNGRRYKDMPHKAMNPTHTLPATNMT